MLGASKIKLHEFGIFLCSSDFIESRLRDEHIRSHCIIGDDDHCMSLGVFKVVRIAAREGKRKLDRLDEKGAAWTNLTWVGEFSMSRGDQVNGVNDGVATIGESVSRNRKS